MYYLYVRLITGRHGVSALSGSPRYPALRLRPFAELRA